jgi:ankyrin repeat protein
MTQQLLDAVAAGDADVVQQLVSTDPALVHARNPDGVSAIVWARYAGKPEMAEMLAASAAQLDLAEAAALGRVERVRELLDSGSKVDERTPDGFTALHYAAFFGHPALARLLVERGAGLDLPARNDMRVTALHSAAAGRHQEIALLLIEAGADVNALQQSRWTPLHAAAQHGDATLADALLAHGADPHARAEDGTTPAELAAAGGFSELAARLAGPAPR